MKSAGLAGVVCTDPRGFKAQAGATLGCVFECFHFFTRKLDFSSFSFSFPPSLLPPFSKPGNPGGQGKG